MSHCDSLLLMRVVVIDEWDGSCLPGRLQNAVGDSLLVRAVVPLWQVTAAVTVRWRATHLNAVDTSSTLQPTHSHNTSVDNCNASEQSQRASTCRHNHNIVEHTRINMLTQSQHTCNKLTQLQHICFVVHRWHSKQAARQVVGGTGKVLFDPY